MKVPGYLRIIALSSIMLVPHLAFSQDFQKTAQEVAARWDDTFNKGNAAGLVKFYDPNATLLPPGSHPVSGAKDIEQFFTTLFQKGFGKHKIDVQGGEAKGDLGYVYGHWQATGPGEDGKPKQYEGNWMNVLEHEAGQWRTVLHAWN